MVHVGGQTKYRRLKHKGHDLFFQEHVVIFKDVKHADAFLMQMG